MVVELNSNSKSFDKVWFQLQEKKNKENYIKKVVLV